MHRICRRSSRTTALGVQVIAKASDGVDAVVVALSV